MWTNGLTSQTQPLFVLFPLQHVPSSVGHLHGTSCFFFFLQNIQKEFLHFHSVVNWDLSFKTHVADSCVLIKMFTKTVKMLSISAVRMWCDGRNVGLFLVLFEFSLVYIKVTLTVGISLVWVFVHLTRLSLCEGRARYIWTGKPGEYQNSIQRRRALDNKMFATTHEKSVSWSQQTII